MAAPFVDTARITVKAGSGGNGAVAFHREKYVAAGGPDGGDGGRGGSVILEINEHMSTLMDFRYKRKYVAANGMDGQGKRCSGKDGEDLVIKVPRGTVVRDAETGEIICDMSQTDRFVLARGGNGGWGNKHFATPTRQVPRFAKAGLPGQEQGPAQDRQLPFHHLVSQSGRGVCGGGCLLRPGRHPRHHRGGG
jgi:GTP-binding protein